MKTARKMFEELGFDYERDILGILYTNEEGLKVCFDDFDNGYKIETTKVQNKKNKSCLVCIGIDVHKAIHQQMKELRWLNE